MKKAIAALVAATFLAGAPALASMKHHSKVAAHAHKTMVHKTAAKKAMMHKPMKSSMMKKHTMMKKKK